MTRRKRLTSVHKANVLKLTDGLFLREVRAVAAGYPDLMLDEVIVDAASALLIRDPGRFDVIVTTNMFGDILSDESSELTCSLGLGGSINASRSAEHTSELQSLMRISYAVLCLTQKTSPAYYLNFATTTQIKS